MTPSGVHVVEHGAGAGAAPVVVLVHGTMDRSTAFAKTARLLDDLRVVTYDRRGYGRSVAAAPAAGFDDHVADLLAVVGDRRAAVVGHSMGGVVAIAASIAAPDRVAAVGAYEPPTPWLPEWPADTAGGVAVEAAIAVGPEAAAEAFMRRIVGDATWEALPEQTKSARRAEGVALLCDIGSVRDRAAFDPAAVTVPVLLAHGSDARPQHLAGTPKLARLIPDAQLEVFEGAGHGAHTSHPERFAEFVRATVRRLS